MPTYHYRCASCNHEFDQYQRFSDDSLTDCPVCSGNIRRVIHNVGVVFKGSGWYITDSRAAKESGGKSAENGASTDGAKPAAKEAEAKKPASEPKSDSKVPAAT